MRRWLDRAWPPSRIGLRLLAFNLLVVFVPVIGVWYLDVYESRLLRAQEREMVQHARVLAAATSVDDSLDVDRLRRIVAGLGRQTDARVQLFDAQGQLLLDSTRIAIARSATADPSAASDEAYAISVRGRLLYRVGAWMVRVRRVTGDGVRFLLRPAQPASVPTSEGSAMPVEIRAALAGRYGAATRETPGQRSLTLFSAVPVRDGKSVIGAVVVSQSTFRSLQAIYDVRLRIFQVIVASLLASAMLTTLAAMTIVRPLRRLRRQAAALTGRRGPLPPSFPGADRKDELGDLARALEDLARRVNEHIGLLEGFAADVSHEFRNPLASIRTAAEMMGEAERPEDRERFRTMLLKDVDRLERLVAGAREMARIDGQIEQDPHACVDLLQALHHVVDRASPTGGQRVTISGPAGPVIVRGSSERIEQVFENLVSNALSLSPAGSAVEISLAPDGVNGCTVSVADRGPGIPEGHTDRIFERFFTYRPATGRGDHTGLGLAITRRIVDGYGGAIHVRNREGGGAVFEVRLSTRQVTQA